jgi:cupin 2 domain-containing protein
MHPTDPISLPLSGNLFTGIPGELPEEWSETLAEAQSTGSIRFKRLVSRGHASPPGFWYDQDTTEWVTLLSGSATLSIEGHPEPLTMRPGDWVLLPAHCRHRVEDTAAGEDSVWLAVHFSPA